MTHQYCFKPIETMSKSQLDAHMTHPTTAKHLPLLKDGWTETSFNAFQTSKRAYWERNGLGHWAIYDGETYIGWGGFQKEGENWDFGLVLHPDHFGHGPKITLQALQFAKQHAQIASVTFLLPPSRKNHAVLARFGAKFEKSVTYDGEEFLLYRIATT